MAAQLGCRDHVLPRNPALWSDDTKLVLRWSICFLGWHNERQQKDFPRFTNSGLCHTWWYCGWDSLTKWQHCWNANHQHDAWPEWHSRDLLFRDTMSCYELCFRNFVGKSGNILSGLASLEPSASVQQNFWKCWCWINPLEKIGQSGFVPVLDFNKWTARCVLYQTWHLASFCTARNSSALFRSLAKTCGNGVSSN